MSYVLVGGTFNCLHAGHEKILRKAFSLGGDVLVCLTSDTMADKKHLSEKIAGYGSRRKMLVEFLSSGNFRGRAEIVKIEDPFSEGLRPSLTHIVVSPETKANAEKINAMRAGRGLRPMKIVEVGWVLAADGKPISGKRIRRGEISGVGRLLGRLSRGRSPEGSSRRARQKR